MPSYVVLDARNDVRLLHGGSRVTRMTLRVLKSVALLRNRSDNGGLLI